MPRSVPVRMPSCRLKLEDELLIESDAGSAIVVPDWQDASVETDWRGTKVEVSYAGATVVIADYDCAGTMKEVMSH